MKKMLGIVIAFPLFSMSYYTMVRTSTPEFCASCHEIKPAVVAWRSSTHTNNAAGVVVDCMDCHLPAPQDTFDFFFSKSYHGIKDVAVHFFEDDTTVKRPAKRPMPPSTTISARNAIAICCTCPTSGAPCWPTARWCMPGKGYEKKCVDCHYDLVHSERGLVMFRQTRNVPYQAKGTETTVVFQIR
jgi:nitrate/TMAO reductase-like tetraheme cytochrome c subunit